MHSHTDPPEVPDIRKGNRLYRYCVSQDVLKRGPDACPVGRVPAAEIEAAVIDQLRGIFRQPEIVFGARRAARDEQDDITEDEAREAVLQLDPLWDELFPAEQARIVQLTRWSRRWRGRSGGGRCSTPGAFMLTLEDLARPTSAASCA